MLTILKDITPAIKVRYHYRHHGTVFNGITIKHMENRYYLPFGQNDTVHAFQFGVGTYVLNINESKGYIGLNSYMGGREHNPINSVYLHGTQEIKEKFGDQWKNMEPTRIAAVLFGCLS
ncbi:hypothetical protein [Geomesophilobacter sediminis]|uniref:Uncharacterized protein n=1 Tax=Geomesophilobacter sediminis TaxID=2798584 RepID=A0A8J7S742_9BACT|nr:hypothetical protein [Geomesophilobacter sediminis]MBJ6726806.1 hypothetical protein [Geomesophilobacter sediminis]